MPTSLDQIAAALVVALEDSNPGEVSSSAIKLLTGVAPDDRITVANAAIDAGADFSSVNRLLDIVGSVMGEVSPTRVTCETASPKTIEAFHMDCSQAHVPGQPIDLVSQQPAATAIIASTPWYSNNWAKLLILAAILSVGVYVLSRRRRPSKLSGLGGLSGPRVSVDIDAMHPAITNSTRAVLKAHGFDICRGGETLSNDRYEKLLREIGRNSAGVIALEADDE